MGWILYNEFILCMVWWWYWVTVSSVFNEQRKYLICSWNVLGTVFVFENALQWLEKMIAVKETFVC